MPYYKITWGTVYAGTEHEDEIEADSLEEAEEEARENALQLIEWNAEIIDKVEIDD